jgi:branched-chain amino acid transport system substrate-binding protein
VSISTHPDITAKAGVGGNPWVFRTVPNDVMLAQVIAKELGAAAYKTIAFLAEDTDYGRGAVALLKTKLGPDLKIISEDYVKNSETDFLQVLTRLRSAKPDALGIYMLDQQGFNFMRQYVQFGMSTPLVARPPLVSALVADLLATGKFNGSWTVYPYYDAYNSAPNRAFVEPFKKLHDQGPHYVAFGMYEGFMIAADAIARAGSAEPSKMRDALKATHYEGILGKVEFDAHGQAHNSLMFLKVNDGKLRVQDLVRG